MVDQEEFEMHKINYHYSPMVIAKVNEGLQSLLAMIRSGQPPFHDETVMNYYGLWKKNSCGL